MLNAGSVPVAFRPEPDTEFAAPSREYIFECAQAHLTVLRFAEQAEAPVSWDCSICHQDATIVGASDRDVVTERSRHAPAYDTAVFTLAHHEALRGRRSTQELEMILQERLSQIRS